MPLILSSPLLQALIIQVVIDEMLLKQKQETDIAEAGRPYRRRQWQLELWVYQLAHEEPHDILPLHAPSPAFGHHQDTIPGLQKRKSGMRQFTDTSEWTPTRLQSPSMRQAQGGRNAHQHKHKRKKRQRQQKVVENDVTNAFGTTQASLPRVDTNVFEHDRQRSSTSTDSDTPSSALTYSSARPLLLTPRTTPASSHFPTLHYSSPPPIPLPGAAHAEASTMGRERRVRKSVSYAESKLNTKVGKPDPVPTQLKQASSGASQDDDIPMVTER